MYRPYVQRNARAKDTMVHWPPRTVLFTTDARIGRLTAIPATMSRRRSIAFSAGSSARVLAASPMKPPTTRAGRTAFPRPVATRATRAATTARNRAQKRTSSTLPSDPTCQRSSSLVVPEILKDHAADEQVHSIPLRPRQDDLAGVGAHSLRSARQRGSAQTRIGCITPAPTWPIERSRRTSGSHRSSASRPLTACCGRSPGCSKMTFFPSRRGESKRKCLGELPLDSRLGGAPVVSLLAHEICSTRGLVRWRWRRGRRAWLISFFGPARRRVVALWWKLVNACRLGICRQSWQK